MCRPATARADQRHSRRTFPNGSLASDPFPISRNQRRAFRQMAEHPEVPCTAGAVAGMLATVNRPQRLAMTAALAVGLVVVGWTVMPTTGGLRCGSAVTAAFQSEWPEGRSLLRGPSPCRSLARDRLVTGAVIIGLAGAFAAGSYRLLRD